MKKLTATICLTIAVLLGSAEVRGSDLPPCPSDQTKRYHNCFGKRIFSEGVEYIGEWQNDRENGDGTYKWANGSVYIGGFKNSTFHGLGSFKYSGGGLHPNT